MGPEQYEYRGWRDAAVPVAFVLIWLGITAPLVWLGVEEPTAELLGIALALGPTIWLGFKVAP